MNDIKCTHCGSGDLAQGFLDDGGQASKGYTRWIAGALELNMLGYAKRSGKPRCQIDAYRCPQCAHLEFFAPRLD